MIKSRDNNRNNKIYSTMIGANKVNPIAKVTTV